ncbi:hypothetical protein [Anaerobacillus sp. 1_MG-2023]|uniref:hypothetical protein n=1 Tax=Anaerobacillus sp. 1_MG-2023 TaxID=3062655 RepID=UPI0026E32569|nr:hypothetical protein [Anaerobacillus sp. 1_MG-2023]MDO6657856.1 hypothetical protein [Anaerobacillus sp. 1_MG-2023]
MNETIKHTPNDIQIIKVPKDEAAKLIKHYAIQYKEGHGDRFLVSPEIAVLVIQ